MEVGGMWDAGEKAFSLREIWKIVPKSLQGAQE